MNISKFTQKSVQAVQDLEKVAYQFGNQEIEEEHLLYALLEQEDSLILKLIEKMEIDKDYFRNSLNQALDAKVKVSGGELRFGQYLNKALVSAEDEAKAMGDEYVSVEHLFLALLRYPSPSMKKLFQEFGITKERFLQALSTVRGNQRVVSDNPEATYDTLNKYGADLVERARDQKLDPVIGTMACPVCGTALQPDDVWLEKGSSGWYTLSQCPVCKGRGGEAGRGVFQKYRMSRRDGLHWAFARCVQMPDDASLANWKRQRAQYLERQRIKAEKQAAEAAQNT